MKRWILWWLLLGLAACGRSEQTTTGTGEWMQMEGKLITVYPTPRAIEPTSTPYVPQLNGASIEIDMTEAALRSRFAVTMWHTQTLHLFSAASNLLYFEWGIQFEPTAIAATLDGEPVASIEGFMPYDPNGPPENLRLTPLVPGTSVMTVYLRYDVCADCYTASPITIYTITVE